MLAQDIRTTKERESNIELFRIIVMLLIIAHHYYINSTLNEVVFANIGTPHSIY